MEEDDESDAELLGRLAGGDQQALATLFDRHAAAVTRYAWALAPNRMDVEEIVQDTFLTAWRKSAEVTLPDVSLLPWLLVTCRNLARNLARKAQRHAADALPDDAAGGRGVAAGRDHTTERAREELQWVLAEIDRLEPLDRRICELCLVEGHPYAEAAERLGLTVGALKQRVSRNRARLRRAVTADEN
ncbi:RNA polymerase sigma factor [Agromyces binzhouensis]|uniref:RNA polymerase sigma factor n=1 Tax=Agromyces binzhouensis TaxID=1817495 RepID=A0A4Q2JLQ5_9MICO|nr:RNA polymerase sigma factor [Agromyces binzhouensis]RXZ47137.1 RNA polymerase sigma factor [Agromyces binzhouensis]